MAISDVVPVRSDRCGLDELFLSYEPGAAERARLALGPGWTRQWTATWQVPGGDEVSLVMDLGPVPVAGREPVRRLSWGRRQRHRPGLQFMVSTGRVHGFAVAGGAGAAAGAGLHRGAGRRPPAAVHAPVRGRRGGFLDHVPDFLAVFRDGSRWLLDVRPARLVGEDDAVRFAAAAEAALEAGWRYSVVAGWRPHVRTGDAAVPSRPAGQPPVLEDLTDYQREVVRLRVAHLLEAETGFRSGDPLHPEPGEPRPAYDPGTTLLGQRRRAKAAELNALGGEEAALLGLGRVSERTLRRMAGEWKGQGAGRVHRRAVAPAGGWAPQHHRGGAGGDLRGPEGDQRPLQDQHEGQARPGRTVRRREVRGRCPGSGLLDAEWVIALFTDRSAIRMFPDLRLLVAYMSVTRTGGCLVGVSRGN